MRAYRYFLDICAGALMEGNYFLPADVNARSHLHEHESEDDPNDFLSSVPSSPPDFEEAYDALGDWLDGPGGKNLREWLDDPNCNQTIVNDDDSSGSDDPKPTGLPKGFDDPTKPPTPGKWKWEGEHPDQPGVGEGAWVNVNDRDESWHPDLAHPDPKGPHWDVNLGGKKYPWYPDRTFGPAESTAACIEA